MAINDSTSDAAPEDGALVRAVLAGDRSAYAPLYDRYARLVRAICFDATRNLADAQDLAQETFLRAFRQLNDLRRPERYGAWLVGIARMVCRQWRQNRARDRRGHEGIERQSVAEPETSSDDGVIQRLHEALLQLPEKERLAIRAFYLLDSSPDRARAVLNLSRSGLYKVLGRARSRLRRLMQDFQEDLP